MAVNLKLIFNYFWLNIKKEWQYKTSFIMQMLIMILNDLFFIIQWVIIFSIVDDIAGYGFNEIMLLWAISAGSYGIAHAFFGGTFRIKDFVYDGKLDVYLTQPKNVLINVCCSATEVSALGDIAYSFVVLVIIGAKWWWYLAIIPIIILGGLLYVAMYVVYSSLAFYIRRGDSVATAIEGALLKTDKYPLAIFNSVTKWILFTIIPAAFFTLIPATHILLGFDIYWILGYVGFVALWIIAAFICFHKGLKRYNSGSLMGGRL